MTTSPTTTGTKIAVSRDGLVTLTTTLGHVIGVELDKGLTRYFHDGSEHETQRKGFGYKSRNEAARQLAKMVAMAEDEAPA